MQDVRNGIMKSIATSTDPLVVIKGNCLLDCNEAALALFNYPDKSEFLALQPFDLLSHHQPDGISAPQKMLYLFEHLHEEGIVKEGVICLQKGGRSFFADLQMISLSHDGEPLFYSKWLCNKQKGESIQFLEDLALNFNTEDKKAIFLLDKEGKILYVSPAACAWLNFAPDELVSQRNIMDLLTPISGEAGKLKEKLVSVFDQSDEKEQEWEEWIFLNKENQLVQGKVGLKVLTEDLEKGPYLQVVVEPRKLEDLHIPDEESSRLEIARLQQENKNLKRVQKILKKSLERFRVLAEYSPDAIMQFDRSHRHLFVNSQVEALTGYKPEEFLGKTHKELGFPLEFSRTCVKVLDSIFQDGESKRLELMLPNGVWVDWFLIPEFNSLGEVKTIITTARDITDQKHTQLKLQKSERKLNDAFEVTKLSSWEYDFKTDEVLLNSKFRKLIGMENSETKKLGSKEYIENFVIKEDAGKFRYVLEAAFASCREDFQEVLDYRIRRPDGEIVHILASVRLEIGEDGRIAKAYGTSQDITELRLTEQELEEYRTSLERLVETRTQELKKSEAKLADALRLANLGTWEYDPLLDCFIVSNEVLEIMGTTSEIEGGNYIGINRSKEIIYPEDYEVYREAVLRAKNEADENYTEHTELRILRSDGKVRHIYLSIKTSRLGNHLKFFGTLQDITDIRDTEFEKDRLNAIIEATSDIVAIIHPNGHLIYMNRAGKEFFGIKEEEELENRTIESFQSFKSSKKISRKEFEEADVQGTWSGESLFLRFNGMEVPVSQVIISHKNGEGQVECYSTIIRDISQQKKIEQDLIYKNNELDTFVYRASHDLRGPIATLMGLYNLVQYEVQEEGALRLFDMYNSQILRLNTITLTLIELTKIKEREFQPSVVNFKKIVRNVFSKMQGMTESQDMLFEQDIESIEGFVSDERLLLVILQNMVENSIKYKRQEADSFVRVEIKTIDDSGRVMIKVSDNGIGIDSNIQHKIYNMFFRGNERSSGSGLGLYILKNAVEKLGGRVALYSVLYKGTTFKIELPPLTGQKLFSSGKTN